MVPRTIAENSGLNATEAVALLHAAHASGQTRAGLDIETGQPRDLTADGIVDVYSTKWCAPPGAPHKHTHATHKPAPCSEGLCSGGGGCCLFPQPCSLLSHPDWQQRQTFAMSEAVTANLGAILALHGRPSRPGLVVACSTMLTAWLWQVGAEVGDRRGDDGPARGPDHHGQAGRRAQTAARGGRRRRLMPLYCQGAACVITVMWAVWHGRGVACRLM